MDFTIFPSFEKAGVLGLRSLILLTYPTPSRVPRFPYQP
jgi:hypothetical protein